VFKRIVTGLKFNFYEIDNDLDVFVAFEVMNNRGKPLSTLELMKNRLIYLTTLLENDEDDKNRLRRDINEAWKTVYEYLGKNKDNPLDDDEFLKNHWIMYFTFERGEAEAFKNFLLKTHFTAKNILDDNAKKIDFSNIENYIDSISHSIKMWFYIFNPHYSNFRDETKEWLNKLNRVGLGAFTPLVMAALVKGIDEQKLVELLKLCEKAVFLVFRISRRPVNLKNNYFFRLAHEFYYDEVSIWDVIKNLNEFIDGDGYYSGWYDLDRFNLEDEFRKKEGEGFYSWNGLKYFLYEYELDLQKKARGQVKISWETIKHSNDTIEHIYPQKAQDRSWKEKFPGKESKQKYILHSLGNLVLLSQAKNSELQNKPFNEKKKHKDEKGNEVGYFNGSYSEIEVSQYQDWTPRQVLERGTRLLEFMEQRWGIKISNKKKVLCWK